MFKTKGFVLDDAGTSHLNAYTGCWTAQPAQVPITASAIERLRRKYRPKNIMTEDLTENNPRFTIDPSQLKVIAYVKFPPVAASCIVLEPYIDYWLTSSTDEDNPHGHDEFGRLIVTHLCQDILMVSTMVIMESISAILSEWDQKLPWIYSSVQPEECFFGIDEGYVLANMKNILSQRLSRAFNTPQSNCESVSEFSRLVAREIASRVNYQVAVRLHSNRRHLTNRTDECNFTYLESLDAIVDAVCNILNCTRLNNCQCPAQQGAGGGTVPQRDSRGNKTQHLVTSNGGCDIVYLTAERAVLDILTEVTQTHSAKDERDFYEDLDSSGSSDLEYSEKSGNAGDGNYDAKDVSGEAEDSVPIRESGETPHSDPSRQPLADCTDVSSVSESAEMSDDNTNRILVVTVLIGLLTYTIKKAQATMDRADFNRIVKNLKDEALQQIELGDITVSANKDEAIERIYKALFRDLCERFDSAWGLLLAIESQLVDEVLIEALKIHLTAPTKQKNAVSRFFSSVGKATMRPFKACFCGSSIPSYVYNCSEAC
ncbi:putative high mobility group nucleosome-binding domain-containing protein 5 [Scophthalmus maximus]|uniref:Putative high mobility group nucleosome-binding domain-containing protein 5 n=1 Tax=Scophthalmus maximus TaxID=52904 RepID=A0A2U9BYN1_SCOMX|nr:putative high mobility group nucleosome-binding domain-containing protein 5 [Scophthalmus maximus]